MLHHVANSTKEYLFVSCLVPRVAGLQVPCLAFQPFVAYGMFAVVDHFHLVGFLDGQLCAGAISPLGRAGHPVYALGIRHRAVGLHRYIILVSVEEVCQFLVHLQSRLPAREDHEAAAWRGLAHPLHYLLLRQRLVLVEVCVTKRTAQVATAEAHEYGRAPRPIAFAL